MRKRGGKWEDNPETKLRNRLKLTCEKDEINKIKWKSTKKRNRKYKLKK